VGFGLAVVLGTVDDCSTVLGVRLAALEGLLGSNGVPAGELICCTVLLPVSPLVWPCR
jgi:hypothetical protein